MATNLLHHPARAPRIPAVARILSQFDRPHLEGFISVAISLLDVLDGDPDEEAIDAFGTHPDDEDDDPPEAVGDEEDGTRAEDEAGFGARGYGPGCIYSDPGGCEHDGREDGHDAERETYACFLDHPPELHVGRRPGWTEPKA